MKTATERLTRRLVERGEVVDIWFPLRAMSNLRFARIHWILFGKRR